MYSALPIGISAPTASSGNGAINMYVPSLMKSEIGGGSGSSSSSGSNSISVKRLPTLQSTRGVVTQGHDQIAAANHYDNLKRTKETQADSFIYHMKRYNNWVKTMLIHGAEKAKGIHTHTHIDTNIHKSHLAYI
jgi:mRNA capping enzyme